MRDLWPHQVRAVQKGLEQGSIACFFAPGAGKTRVALELLQKWGATPCLVLAPGPVAHVWAEQVKEWASRIPIRLLAGGSVEARKVPLMLTRGIAVVNYEAFWGLREVIREQPWKCVILDEAHRISSPGARITRAIWNSENVRKCSHRIALTPWPARKRLEDVFSVVRFVDRGATLGTRAFDFRLEYFVMDPRGFGWEPQPGAEERIGRKIASISTVVREDEVTRTVGLPESTRETYFVELGAEHRRLYREAEKDWALEGADIKGGGTRALRLRQIPCGVIGDRFEIGAKTKGVLDILGGVQGRAIVYAWFRLEVNGVAKAVTETGRWARSVLGGDDVQEALRAWRAQGDGVLVVEHALAEGWGATEARWCIFHSQPPSAFLRYQCIRRLVRPGQTASVRIIDVVSRDTMDEGYLQAIEEEKDWIDYLRNCAGRTVAGRMENSTKAD